MHIKVNYDYSITAKVYCAIICTPVNRARILSIIVL